MFGGITYKIDLREKEGNRIKDVKYKDGRELKDTDVLKLGMNSYRLGQLQGKGGIFEGKEFKKLWDSKTAYGEEEGTIRNLAIDYIKNVKNGLINAKKQNNWCLLGIDPNSENYKKVRDLVNSGELKIPTSEDGKYTNIASINEKDLPSDNNTSKENEENINLDSINNKNNKDQVVNEESKKDVPKVEENIEKQKNNKENNSNEDNTLVKEDSKSKEVNEKNNEQNNIEEVSKKENKLPNTGSPIGAEAMSQIGMLLLGAGVILKKKNKK